MNAKDLIMFSCIFFYAPYLSTILPLYHTAEPHWPPSCFFKALFTFLRQGFCLCCCHFRLNAVSPALWLASPLTSFSHMIAFLLSRKKTFYLFSPYPLKLKSGFICTCLKLKQFILGEDIS